MSINRFRNNLNLKKLSKRLSKFKETCPFF